MSALDTDKDGTLSSDEIANASESLKKLDKNGDGQLTPDEYRPRPTRPRKRSAGREQGPSQRGRQSTAPAPQDNNAANPKKRPPAE